LENTLQAPTGRSSEPLIVRVNYAIRAGAFAYACLTLGLHGLERGFGPLFWIFLAAIFLVYPHLVYLYTRKARNPKNAEVSAMYVDAALLGAWAGGLGFPTWIAYPALFSTSLNATWIRGVQGGLFSMAAFSAGCALAVAATGLRYLPETSDTVTALCFVGSVIYTSAIGYVMHVQTRRLAAARDARLESEQRYRLIAENAAELIAMVDRDGRWLYASPSYGRILDAADLEPGVDAFRRVHPDDADQARIAVMRSTATGEAREIPLRLVDREGRIRQFRTRVKAAGDGSLVLISHDVTDLRENEEKLLLAAHALEGMTEAILITAADGTVVTVNKAFCDITGYTRTDVLGSPETAIRNALQPPEFYEELHAIVARDGYWSGTTWAKRKNGSVYREWRSIRAVREAAGKLTHYVVVFYEVGVARPREEGSLREDGSLKA
jgi:PAS domain S-box-containing protein